MTQQDTLWIGSAPDSDVVIPGLYPKHARIIRQVGPQGVSFILVGSGPMAVGTSPVGVGQAIVFELSLPIFLANIPFPKTHPAVQAFLRAGTAPQYAPPPPQQIPPQISAPRPEGPGNVAALQGSQVHAAQAHAASQHVGAPPRHQTMIGSLQSADAMITIGRTPENKIVVPHPQVSSRHAQLTREGNQTLLEDLRSANGTFVRGQRLAPGQRVPVANGEKIFLGPMPLVLALEGSKVGVAIEDQQASWAGKPTYEIEAWDLLLEVPDRDDKTAVKTLLDHVSFKALPGDMIALMGPSGAGKTTLLLTLNGYMPPTSGQVRVNGEDLYVIYDALRGSIGYVPQDDIVHPELTVFEAVRYSAQFRLPPDYSDEEIDARVTQTLKDLGLEGVANLQIGKPEKKVLSGGQRKRVNIALELVTDPVILFLDEPTSGLAADDTTALISLLAELTKRTGKTIVMTIHQPAKDEFEKFNLAFIMGYGGIPVYFGPTGNDAYRFFSSILDQPGNLAKTHAGRVIDNPRDMFDMLNVRERATLEEMKARDPSVTRNTARMEAARRWRTEFFRPANAVFSKMYTGARAIGSGDVAKGSRPSPYVPLFEQLQLLISRYWKVKTRDRAGALIMFLQAPIIGIMLAIVFGGQKPSIPFWCLGALNELSKAHPQNNAQSSTELLNAMQTTNDHTGALFFVVVSCVWFGTSNAAREIVTERAIYLRERMVNLSLVNYVLSKYLVLAFVCILQCTMLLAIVFFSLGFSGGMSAFFAELAVMIAVSLNAAALGLLLSAGVSSAEAAMALTPIALIPQVVLGGLMVPMTTNPLLRPLMMLMPSRWGFQGAVVYERTAVQNAAAWVMDLKRPGLTSPSDYLSDGKFKCAIAQMGSSKLPGAWGFTDWATMWLPHAVLFGMTGAMLVLLLLFLKRRDPV